MSEIKIENPQELIEAVEKSLEQAIEKYEAQVKDAGKASNEVRDEVKALSEQHAELVKKLEGQEAKFDDFRQTVTTGMVGGGEKEKSWGETLVESEGFKAVLEGNSPSAKVQVKNTILGEAGSPQNPSNVLVPEDRLSGIFGGAFRALNVLDFFPTGATSSNQIQYTRELSNTNNAAETSEGATKPESAITFELVDDPVRTIAHWLKLSRQVLDDAPLLQSYVDRRLRHGLRNRLELQILRGNGTAPNISGLSASGRHTAFTPTASETEFDAISRAKYAVIGDDRSANVLFLNPADWGKMERRKVGTSNDDTYLVGQNAIVSHIQNGLVSMVWGLPVVTTNNVEEGKFYVLDSNETMLVMRQAASVEMFAQDEDNVQKNLITVRAELRAALAVFAAGAIRFGDLLA